MVNEQELWQSVIQSLANNRVRPEFYRGKSKDIEAMPGEDGALYFAYDSGTIFLGRDTGSRIEKIPMSSTAGGGGGSGIVYAYGDEEEGTLIEIEDETSEDYGSGNQYYISRTAFEEDLMALPTKDMLVINSNGWLFRVLKALDNKVLALLVSTGTV